MTFRPHARRFPAKSLALPTLATQRRSAIYGLDVASLDPRNLSGIVAGTRIQ